MLSPYKLYKHDQPLKHTAVTWGPRGKPYKGSKGTLCYNHPNVDWTVHRLAPTIAQRSKPNSIRRKVISRATTIGGGDRKWISKNPARNLQVSSPRWGEGFAPSLHGRKPVPLPKKGTVEVSGGTKAVVGAAVVGTAGYEAYKHRKQIKEKAVQVKQKAAQFGDHVHDAFHSTHHAIAHVMGH